MSHFQLPLNCLFMGTAASERNQDLREEQKHWSDVKLNLQISIYRDSATRTDIGMIGRGRNMG